jgi:DNA-binding MarR family transcriptional regulator/GNAT superfamily N-acetyltransferase
MPVATHEQDLPSHIRHALRLYGRLGANVDRRLASMERPVSHRKVLIELLERPGQVDVNIASSLGMDRSFLSRTLGSLVIEGLIESAAGKGHRGQRHLSLTDAGRTLAEQCLVEHIAAIRAEFISLESEDQNQLMASLSFHLTSDLSQTWEGHVYIRPSEYTDYIWFLSEFTGLKKAAIEQAFANAALAVSASLQNRPDVELRLTALRGEKPVGICLLSISTNGTELYLSALHVTPQARESGIGSQLLDRAINTATEHTYSKIHAFAGDGEVSLTRLLEKKGFERKRGGQRTIQYGTLQTVFHWIKSLPVI